MKKMYEMFVEIALPFSRGMYLANNNYKEVKILEILKELNPSYIPGVGIIVPSEEETKKVIVSHIDLVKTFQKGFSEGKAFFVDGEKMQGALDNTLTNSFLILAILELRSQGLAKDVQFLFTEGEETGLTGMRNYMQNIFPTLNNPFFINLDVTNDNWDYSGSIEFDYPDLDICKEIENQFPGLNGFTHQRFTDDTSAIVSMGGSGFSFCIPTKKYCHTYDSYTLIEKLKPYYNILIYLIKDLDTSNYRHNSNLLNTKMVQGA